MEGKYQRERAGSGGYINTWSGPKYCVVLPPTPYEATNTQSLDNASLTFSHATNDSYSGKPDLVFC